MEAGWAIIAWLIHQHLCHLFRQRWQGSFKITSFPVSNREEERGVFEYISPCVKLFTDIRYIIMYKFEKYSQQK